MSSTSPSQHPSPTVVEGFEEFEIPDSVFLDQPMDGLPPLVDTTRRLELAAEQLAVRLVVPLGLCHLPAFVCLGVLPLLLTLLRGPA